jgi:hypothetical protein
MRQGELPIPAAWFESRLPNGTARLSVAFAAIDDANEIHRTDLPRRLSAGPCLAIHKRTWDKRYGPDLKPVRPFHSFDLV